MSKQFDDRPWDGKAPGSAETPKVQHTPNVGRAAAPRPARPGAPSYSAQGRPTGQSVGRPGAPRPARPGAPRNSAQGRPTGQSAGRPSAPRPARPGAPVNSAQGRPTERPGAPRPARPSALGNSVQGRPTGQSAGRPGAPRPARPGAPGNAAQGRPVGRPTGRPGAPQRGQGGKRPDAPAAKKAPKDQTPTLARRIALEALLEVEREGAFTTLALDRHLNAHPSMPPEDRRLTTALFYGVMERRMALDYVLAQFMQRPPQDDATRMNLRLAALQMLYMNVPDYAACGEAVSLSRYIGREALCSLVNAVLREMSRKKEQIHWPEDPDEKLSITTSTPLWLTKVLIEEKGFAAAERYLSYVPKERFTSLRVNPLQSDIETVKKELAEAGMYCVEGSVPGSLRVHGSAPTNTKAFHQGAYSVQGEASMLAVLAAGVKPGEQVLDACAAPGGKTGMLAEMMRGSGRVHAMDIHAHRVKLIEGMAQRLHLDNIRPRIGDATLPIESMRDSLHAVLVDAPCSGLGVIGGKPDIKYSMKPEQLAELPQKQLEMLLACAQAVKPGGRLVYSTCTVLKAENQDVVEEFLDKRKDFALRSLAECLPAQYAALVQDGMLLLDPERDQTDGFFIARMERTR